MKNRPQSAPKSSSVARAVRRSKPQVLSQSLSRFGSAAAITAALLASAAVQAPAVTYYWDADGSDVGNSTSGTNLGGTGNWDLATANWWDTANPLALWTNTSTDRAIFTQALSAIPTAFTITVGTGITANSLSFLRGGYTLTGGNITLAGTTPGLQANLGESAAIDTQILGTAGLTKTGGGSIRLGNTSNSYTGTTTISNGSLIIGSQAALGAASSAVVVTGFNNTPGNATNLRGMGGGSLVLDGLSSPITFTRDLSLQGQGPTADRGGALISLGNNTLSGSVTTGALAFGVTPINTNLISGNGTLNLTGTLNVGGTALSTVTNLGGTFANQGTVSNYNLTGVLAGTGVLSKAGGGTLFLNPSNSAGFSGTIRTIGSQGSGQSSIRITSGGVLGTRTTAGTGAVLDLNGGILEVLMDSPSVLAGGSPANVFGRASSTLFVDRGVGGVATNGTLTLGQFHIASNQTFTFGGRNGYGITFNTGATSQDLANPNAFTNNLQGGLLTFAGNFWGNTNNTADRLFTFGGNGDTLIDGSIVASSAAFNHSFTKTGTGTLTVNGTATTLDGAFNLNGGTVSTRRIVGGLLGIGTAAGSLNIGTTTTAGILNYVGAVGSGAGETIARNINLAATTGAVRINASQTGTATTALVLSNVTQTGIGAKTLTLGGTSTRDNEITSALANSSGTTTISVTKVNAGTWVLSGLNTYTGLTTISEGTLRIRANSTAASSILADTSSVAFNVTNVSSGGTLELLGAASTANSETVAGLSVQTGSNTVRLTPGSGGSASFVFNGYTIADPATVNFIGITGTGGSNVTLTGLPVGLVTPNTFVEGTNFAFNTATVAGNLRAPVYGTDATFVTAPGAALLPAGQNNFDITGNITAQTSTTVSTLRFNGAQALTLNSGQTLTIRTGAAGTDGGILATGGASTLSGGGITTLGAGSLQFRVAGASDSLTLNSTMAANTTGGVTKSGLGTLILGGANAQTGAFSINEGTVQLRTGGVLSGASATFNIRGGATLDLNGINTGTAIGQFNLAEGGIVTSGTGAATLTVGGGNGTGTAFGVMQDGAGVLSLVKQGTGAHTWSGLSTYTGSTTINSTGILSAPFLANGGASSSIGASSSGAASLVFGGNSLTQAYGGLSYTGTTAVTTNRLFTFGGSAQASGARIQANGVNSAPIVFSNTGSLAFTAGAGTVAQGLVLGGASTGDNRFNPLIADAGAGTAVTSVFKAEAGVWHLGNSANTYTGTTTILGGVLGGNLGTSIPTASNLVIAGGGVLLSTGSITRTVGAGSDQLRWLSNQSAASGQGGGFAAGDSDLAVNLGAGLQWGAQTNGFVGAGPLILGSTVSLAETILQNGFELLPGTASAPAYTASTATQTLTVSSTTGLVLGQPIAGAGIPANSIITAVDSATVFRINNTLTASTTATATILAVPSRTITVNENANTGADQAIIIGVISGVGAGITKAGGGTLALRGANTYDGVTAVTAGALTVSTLGNSASPGATSVGDSTLGNTNAGAITLGNAGTGAGILQYVGAGETSDRKIRLNTTTGTTQIHADGSGPLILTNVANDAQTGAKNLTLRGTNAAGNRITSILADSPTTGALSVTVDGSATWILTGANTYTGTTTSSGGALGVGSDTALGSGTITFNFGTIFAHGADRTVTNAVNFANNQTTGFTGDYNLTLSSVWNNQAGANNFGTNNSIAAGKSLTIGGMTLNALTANRIWTVDGPGDTIVSGDLTSTTAFGVPILKTGNGVLTLRGTGGNFTQSNAGIDIDRGTLRIGASEVIPHTGTATGGITFSPDFVDSDTATLDLNGFNETITVLNTGTGGPITIDNTSTAAGSLTFGTGNFAVTFGASTASRTITDSGSGALSIFKAGTTATSIPLGYTLTHQGTTGVTGGSLTINSLLNGSTGLTVQNNVSGPTSLALTGGITSSAVTSVIVENNATLSLLDGAGNRMQNLTNLQLGSTGGTITTLNLNVGDIGVGDQLNTDLLSLGGGTLSLFAGNQIRFNLSDAGLNELSTYVLLDATNAAIPGGLLTGPLVLADYLLGATPGGFSSISLSLSTDNQILITTGNLITGASYFRGLTNNTWNAAANNWSDDKAGAVPALSIPGQGTDVVFVSDPASVAGGTVATTLEQNFRIASLTFESSTGTPNLVTIAPGAVATNRLEIATQSSTAGIAITTGGPAVASISAPVRLTGDQTWNVADAASNLRISGALEGGNNLDLEKIGAGRVTLGAAAATLFNTGTANANITINGGTVEILNAGALGTTANANLANIHINSGGAFYFNNATTGTVANALTLGGGTLSAGGNTQVYSGAINSTAASTINMADQNGTTASAARSITLAGVISGAGAITVNSNGTLTTGNPLNGTLTLRGANSGWSGPITLNQGTITATDVNALGTGNIAATNGRIIFNGANGTTFSIAQNVSLNAGGTGILELAADNSAATPTVDMTANLSGVVTLSGGSTNALRLSQNTDNFSILNITNSVVLGSNASISVAGSTTRPTVISGVISDGGSGFGLAVNDDLGGWAQTNTILRLTGLNTFSGNVTVDSGTLEFDTVTNISGGASALGNGTALSVGAATLRFIGTSSQTTDRPITQTGASIYSANGTAGASITYAGFIDATLTSTSAHNVTFTGATGSQGFITGGFVQPGTVADALVLGGTWAIVGSSTVADDLTVSNSGTILNVNTADALNFGASGENTFIINTGGVVNINASQTAASTNFERLFVAQAGTGAATLNLGANNLTTAGVGNRLILGERAAGLDGTISGTGGVLTIASGDIDLFRGTISADLGSGGILALEKFGPGQVTLSGNNTALTSTGASIVYEGPLVLDYTTSNTTKLRALSQLDMRGGDLTLLGNAGAPTAQNVASFALVNSGSNTITLTPNGQDIVLNLRAITRAINAQDGTIRFVLPSGTQSSTNGITVNTLNNRTDAAGILGGYATVNDGTGVFFARNATNSTAAANVVAANTTATDSVTAWGTDLNITDSTGFTGTLVRSNINSLRFNAAGASSVNMAQGSILNLNTGGILVTNNAAAGTRGIFDGTLAASGSNADLIITQDSGVLFEVSADIRVNHNVVKSGTGILRLSGNNSSSGYLEILDGTVQLSGGSAMGDNSLVTLSNSRNSTLQLLSNETIGRLQGGQRATNSDYGVVALGANTLTINQSSALTYAGVFTGTGGLVMNSGNTGNLTLTNVSSGYTGAVTLGGGTLILSGIGQLNAASFEINKGGALLLDNNGGTRSGTRILDSTAVTLNSADGAFSTQTVPRGLAFRTDQDSGVTNTEAFGQLNLAGGANYASLEQSGGNASRAFLTATNIVRTNNATFDIRGRALGSTAGTGGQSRLTISDATNQTAFIASMVGGASTAGTTLSIVPWAIGETISAGLLNANMGNSLVTYTAARGLYPLDFATEYNTFAASSAASNVRESSAANIPGIAGTTINSLVLNNNDVATSSVASTINITGSGAGQTLAVTSGAILFTSNTTATAARNINLGGFDSGITVGGTNEYVIHVVNPSAAVNTTALTATIGSPLTSTADITKSGRGTLVLTGLNTAGGASRKTVINEGILEIADLDNIGGGTGALVFAGGTLRLGAGWVDDASTRSITLLSGGGTIDTNGNNATFAGSVGSGIGGLTKSGAGTLNLNGAATFTGGLTVSAGTVAVGVNNATGLGGNLTLAGGTGLVLGANSVNHALVTTSGASPQISGTGTIAASIGFFLNHTGNTQIDAVLAGAGGILKAQANVVTLTGLNTYTGTTEIQGGTISFDSIGNVGGGASALGNPSNTENGIIRAGLTTTATTLNYTGTGHTSNRIIAMQGTTGGLTITQANTAGAALNLGVVQTEVAGAKTLTLNGASSAANSIAGIHEGATGALAVTKAGTGTWVINGANTYTGNTLNSGGGVLRAGNSQAFGTVGTVTLQDTNSVLELANAVDISRPLTVSNTGNEKTLRLLSGATTGTYSGTVNIQETTANFFRVDVGSGGTLTASGVISSGTASAGITKLSPGTLLLPSGTANTYRGITAINDGIVNIRNAASLGATNEGTTVASGATLQVEGPIAVGAEALTLNGVGETGQNGALVNVSGANSWAGNVTLGSASTISTDDGSLTLTGNVANGGFALSSTGDLGGQTAINGNITGAGGLVVSALSVAGHTLTLTPASSNSFSGPTTINQNATLIAQNAGALGGTSGINVIGGAATNAGGTLLLAGTGNRINNLANITLTSATTVAAEAPRFNTAGLSETVGALTLSGNSSTDLMILDLATLNLNNVLTFGASNANTWIGSLQIWNWSGTTLAGGGGNGGAELDQVFFGSSSSALTSGQLSQITFFSDSGSTAFGATVFGTNGQIVPVPEPTGVTIGLALFGLAGWRERRRANARRRDERIAPRA